MGLPSINATGRLTADPELRFTSAGKAVATLGIACNERKTQQGDWEGRRHDSWERRTVGRPRRGVAEQLRRGQLVHVTGLLRQRSYELANGEKRTATEVVKAEIFPALAKTESSVPQFVADLVKPRSDDPDTHRPPCRSPATLRRAV
ncbi:MAG: single-stranded DNA-binding protein [Rhizobiales bacterium]|nr:single-stranded DNA-binding protein [Hyphomicrobiales bacterium]